MTEKAFVLDLETRTVTPIPVSDEMLIQLTDGTWETEPIAFDLSAEQIAELLGYADDLTPEVKEAWNKVAKNGGGLFIVP